MLVFFAQFLGALPSCPQPLPTLPLAPPVHACYGVQTSVSYDVHPRGVRGTAHDRRDRPRRRVRVWVR